MMIKMDFVLFIKNQKNFLKGKFLNILKEFLKKDYLYQVPSITIMMNKLRKLKLLLLILIKNNF